MQNRLVVHCLLILAAALCTEADAGDSDAGRQAARPAILPEVIEHAVGKHVEMHGQGCMVEIDLPAFRLLDAPADLALDLR